MHLHNIEKPGVKPRGFVTPRNKGPMARPLIKLPGRWPYGDSPISYLGLRPRLCKLLDLWSVKRRLKSTNCRCPTSHRSRRHKVLWPASLAWKSVRHHEYCPNPCRLSCGRYRRSPRRVLRSKTRTLCPVRF
jgi:hypothetical protein